MGASGMPVVAIVGRPNVGKSTFFNRITRSRDAIVDNFPGVTRDRIYGVARWDGVDFSLVDTGGFLENDEDGFSRQIHAQIRQAMADADLILLILDGKVGVTPFDRDMIDMVRRLKKPAMCVVNKIDGPEQEDRLHDFYSLGADALFPVSAEHGYGVHEALDGLISALPAAAPEEATDMIRLAVIGRPNVGKSSLINRILGQDRLIVSEQPGATRDAVDAVCTVNGRQYLLIDTAGIRRKGKIRKKIEKLSIIKALKSLDRCDVALIVLDAGQGLTQQDLHVAGYARDRGCGCILLANKWDLVSKDPAEARKRIRRIREGAGFLSYAPILSVSALTGQRIFKIFPLAETVFSQYTTRIGTGALNKIIETAVENNEPPMHRGRRLKFYYAAQIRTRPPTFLCFVNYPEAVHFSYRRYLINQIRKEAGLDSAPIRLMLKPRTGRKTFKRASR